MTDLPTHEAAAAEARHAHRDLLAEKDAEIERLSEILTGIEMLTATGEGLDAEQTISIHLIAAEGRADDPRAWRADPAVIDRLRAAVRGEAARDAEIERLTALLDEATEALEVCNRNTQGLSRDNFAFHCRIAASVSRATLARIKEQRNDRLVVEAERKAWNAALDAARALVGPHLPGIRAVQITALKKGPGEAITALKKEKQG